MNFKPDENWKWIGDWIGQRASLTPQKEALLDATNEKRYTYGELNNRGNQLANLLYTEIGIEKGDRVAFLLSNRVECLDAFAACGKLGAILVPLNVRLAPPEHQEYIKNTTPKVLIYESAFDETIKQFRSHTPSITHYFHIDSSNLEETKSYAKEISKQPITCPSHPIINFEDPFFILPTGGTTGLPKGAILSHRHIFWNAINTIVTWGIGPNDVCPIIFPLFHTGGWNVLTIPLIHVGARMIFWSKFDATDTLLRIEKEGCTIIIGVPTMYQMMINTPQFTSTDFSSVRFWLSGGAPCPMPIMEAFWKRDNQEFAMGYGLTEVGPNNFYHPLGMSRQKPTSVGVPFFHNEVRIINENKQDVQQGEVGELLLRGPHAFSGYWNNPQATKDVIEHDSWVHTGDLAKQDEDGFYYIVGRIKAMWISGGENVFPVEIERVLFEHPDVSEAAVVGMPDEKWGEVGCAFVVLKSGSKISEKELLDFLRQRLARYKVPKRIHLITELPKTSTGKIAKRILEERAKSEK
jgi:fatty-acyl-CoA synthase